MLVWLSADFKYKAHILVNAPEYGPVNNFTESLWLAGSSGGFGSNRSAQRRVSWGKLLGCILLGLNICKDGGSKTSLGKLFQYLTALTVQKFVLCFQFTLFYFSVSLSTWCRAGDNQKVTSTAPWEQPYPNPPGRFDHWHQVLSSKSLCFSCCNNTLRMRYLWLAFSLAWRTEALTRCVQKARAAPQVTISPGASCRMGKGFLHGTVMWRCPSEWMCLVE